MLRYKDILTKATLVRLRKWTARLRIFYIFLQILEISCSSGSNIESKECGNLINCENQKLPTNDEECDNIMDGSVYQKCGPTCVHFCGNVKVIYRKLFGK